MYGMFHTPLLQRQRWRFQYHYKSRCLITGWLFILNFSTCYLCSMDRVHGFVLVAKKNKHMLSISPFQSAVRSHDIINNYRLPKPARIKLCVSYLPNLLRRCDLESNLAENMSLLIYVLILESETTVIWYKFYNIGSVMSFQELLEFTHTRFPCTMSM